MNISGVVRIDLSGYIQARLLMVPDRYVGDVAMDIAGADRVELYVGSAARVQWDERIVDVLAQADEVRIVGDDTDSVESAAYRLRRAVDERIPGPRSAS